MLVALTISAVAAYYSIVGLTAIFAAAALPIIIMGAALEVGKVSAAVWLKMHWAQAKWTYKLYLVPAVAFLMMLTSMGIFGFLSKAHLDQAVPTGDVQAQVQIVDDKIKTQKENIEAARRALKQMDESVDQLMARSTTEQGAGRSAQLRRSQQRERIQLQNDIAQAQKVIVKLQEERAPIASQARKVEAEVGPIKYVAALLYGDNPDANLLERSVRWVIILIVMVFDPLALVLILAAQQSIRWAREAKEAKPAPRMEIKPSTPPPAPQVLSTVRTIPEPAPKPVIVTKPAPKPQPKPKTKVKKPKVFRKPKAASAPEPLAKAAPEQPLPPPPSLPPVPPVLELVPIERKPEIAEIQELQEPNPEPISENTTSESGLSVTDLAQLEPILELGLTVATESEPQEVQPEPAPQPPRIPEARSAYKAPQPFVPETLNPNRKTQLPDANLGLQADNVETSSVPKSGFGIEFPLAPGKGDTFLRVDQLPNRLYKFNGVKWIEVDKSMTDSYSYDEQYIQFLADKLVSGEYELDQLSVEEQELVTQKLKEIADEKAKNINPTTN